MHGKLRLDFVAVGMADLVTQITRYVERGDRGVVEEFAKACDGAFSAPGTFVRLWEDAQKSLFPAWFAPIVPL